MSKHLKHLVEGNFPVINTWLSRRDLFGFVGHLGCAYGFPIIFGLSDDLHDFYPFCLNGPCLWSRPYDNFCG
jgi:hypothetical protein